MRSLNQLIIVHLVERAPAGSIFRRERASWPLHITLVPWFHINPENEAPLLTTLHAYGATHGSFAVRVGGEELFGPCKNVPVNIIAGQARIIQLRDDLIALVKGCGVSERTLINRRYRAHITHHILDGNVRRRQQGDEEHIADFTIGRLLADSSGQMVEIAAHVTLEDA